MIFSTRRQIWKFYIDICRAKRKHLKINEKFIYEGKKKKKNKFERKIKLIDSKLNFNLKTSDDSFIKASYGGK